MSFLRSLPQEPETHSLSPGEHRARGFLLSWKASGLELVISIPGASTHKQVIPAAELRSVQLSGSTYLRPRSWFARLIGRSARQGTRVQAQFCSRRGRRLNVWASCEPEAIEDIGEMEVEGVEVSLESLRACTIAALSLGATLTHDPSPRLRTKALLAPEPEASLRPGECSKCGRINQPHYQFCLGCGGTMSRDSG